jgi:hypothetical protein
VKDDDGNVQSYVKGSEPEQHNIHMTDGMLWGDRHYEGLQATDGTDIGSRTKQREYMRRHGLTTADDFKQTWAQAEKARTEYRTTGKGGAVTRNDIARAIHRLEDR